MVRSCLHSIAEFSFRSVRAIDDALVSAIDHKVFFSFYDSD